MARRRRKSVAEQKSIGLPREYQEVEYLESTGTQYIITNTYLQPLSKVHLKIMFTVNTGNNYYPVFGVYNTISSNMCLWQYGLTVCGEVKGSQSILLNTLYSIEVFNGEIIINNTHSSIDKLKTQSVVPVPIFIHYYQQYQRNRIGYGKLYHFSVDNDLRLLPAYRISDHKPCMFDLVSQQPFFNQGTGADFILGPVVH